MRKDYKIMRLFVVQGTSVNAAWINRVAFGTSSTGPWNTIHKDAVETVGQTRVTGTQNESARAQPFPVEKIHIKLKSGADQSFDIKEVANQVGWNVGGAVALAQAHSDIEAWFN